MTKIVAISDTHMQHKGMNIPECDILIHAGDFCSSGTSGEYDKFIKWFSSQTTAKHKIFIAGNHDHWMQRAWELKVPSNVIYLRDSGIEIEGLKIYGTPWTNYFCGWAFNGLDHNPGPKNNYPGGPGEKAMPNEDMPLLASKYGLIPNDLDILISHGPPYGILDENGIGQSCGSHSLLDKIIQCKPKHVIFGHIHPSRGWSEKTKENIQFWNVCSVDEDYKVRYKNITEFEV